MGPVGAPSPSPKAARASSKGFVIAKPTDDARALLAGFGEEVAVLVAVHLQKALFGETVAACALSDGERTVVLRNPPKEALAAAFEALERAKRVITHDLKALMHATGWKGDQRWSDLMVGSYVLNPGSRAHDLGSAVKELAGESVPELSSYGSDEELDVFARVLSYVEGHLR